MPSRLRVATFRNEGGKANVKGGVKEEGRMCDETSEESERSSYCESRYPRPLRLMVGVLSSS